MKVHFLIPFFMFIYLFIPVLEAQQVVKGRIIDDYDGSPLINASILISNTTVRTSSDKSGNYSITFPGEGSFEIVVSHIGYRSIFYKVDLPDPLHIINHALSVNEMEIKEVIVTPESNKNRQKHIDLFWNKILGEKPSKKGLEVLNPETMSYILDNDSILEAWCYDPVDIINHQTGFRILYTLHSFQHNYIDNCTEYYGAPYFEELAPKNIREKKRWEKNRKEVYSVTFTNFLRALYKEQIHESGFFLVDRDSLKNEKIFPVNLKDILQVEQDIVHVKIKNPLVLMCISKPITEKMIKNSYKEILLSSSSFPVMELRPQEISINSDGTYVGLLKIQEIRKSIFGLSRILPIEYIEK